VTAEGGEGLIISERQKYAFSLIVEPAFVVTQK
jgi:hypothetical protein